MHKRNQSPFRERWTHDSPTHYGYNPSLGGNGTFQRLAEITVTAQKPLITRPLPAWLTDKFNTGGIDIGFTLEATMGPQSINDAVIGGTYKVASATPIKSGNPKNSIKAKVYVEQTQRVHYITSGIYRSTEFNQDGGFDVQLSTNPSNKVSSMSLKAGKSKDFYGIDLGVGAQFIIGGSAKLKIGFEL